ncbi:MAG: YesL family protein [Lachnospiraceae bacterium]
MRELFHLENPIWVFLGKLADMMLLTGLWFLCSLPVVTIGASTTALYYVMLKLTENKEGYIAASFFRAFKENLRQGIAAGILAAAVGIFLSCDLYVYYHMEGNFSVILFWLFLILTCLYAMTFAYLFPLMARCRTDLRHLFVMAFVMSIKNFGWTLLMIVSAGCLFALGIFVMAPLLVFSIGGTAYIHAKILNLVWNEYHLDLEGESHVVSAIK